MTTRSSKDFSHFRKYHGKAETGDKASAPSPAQLEVWRVLEQATSFTNYFFKSFPGLKETWRLVSKDLGRTSSGRLRPFDSLFKAVNYNVLDGPNGISYYPDFHFSIGPLVQPREVKVTREGWMLTIEWEVPNRKHKHSQPHDQLLVGFFYDSRPDAPRMVEKVKATRGEQRATVKIPAHDFPDDEVLHLYLFFKNAEGTIYSANRYVRC